jgi:hypothetical protein
MEIRPILKKRLHLEMTVTRSAGILKQSAMEAIFNYRNN